MIEGELILSDRAGRKIGFTTVWLYDDNTRLDEQIEVTGIVRVKPFYKPSTR